MKVYAGIGSRKPPPAVLERIREIGAILAGKGWTLRSGAAQGADQAFEEGADREGGAKEISLPKEGFRQRTTREEGVRIASHPRGLREARAHHPAWNRLSGDAQLLMIRNSYQVLGDGERPMLVVAVIGYTPGGTGSGGTGQAYRLARTKGVQVVELGAGKWRNVLGKVGPDIRDALLKTAGE